MPTTHYRNCNLCEAMCGLEIQIEDNKVISIKGDKADPFSYGHICPKALGLKDINEDTDRLKQPIKRTASGWETISWEQAFEEVYQNIAKVQEKYGRNAVGIYQGNPNVHNVGTMLFGPNFTRALKTKNRFSATSADQLPHHFAAWLMFGHFLLLPIPDIDHTDFMLILGANPLASNGSIMTVPNVEKRLKKIQERGGKIVVIDPRYSETATKADQHIFIHPGMDAFLLAAIINTLFEEKLVDLGHLEVFTKGVDQLAKLIQDYSPEKIGPIIGIDAQVIRNLTREFVAAPSAVCYGRMGVSTQEFGGVCQWLINVINILTGNLDKRGGAMFTLPAIDTIGQTGARGKKGSFGRWHSRVRNLPEFAGELPVATLAEEILTPGEGQIKAMFTVAGNPVLSTPNGKQLEKALTTLEYMVAIDIYLNETTKYANIILPPATGLETPHYDLVFHTLAVRNTAKFSEPILSKAEDTKFDWEIFLNLAKKFGYEPSQNLSLEQMIDLGLQHGPYDKDGLSLKKLKEAPHGIDLGPLQSCFPDRLFTEDKMVDLVPELFKKDMIRLKSKWNDLHQGKNGFPFSLIGRRQLRSNNSWMHNSYRLVKGKERCTLLLHPNDASRLSLLPKEVVRIVSKVGQIEIPVEISKEMMEGVVSIPHGWGHHREGINMQIASQHPGVSINDLTDESLIDQLTGNAAFSNVPVKIEKIS